MSYNDRSLIDPRLMAHLARTHFPNLVTIGELTTTYDASNEPIFTFAADNDLTDIAAYIEPVLSNQEIRREDQTVVTNAFNIVLAGSYPSIDEHNNLTDDLGRVFNIISASIDGLRTQTIIVGELVNPNPNVDQ